MMEIGAVSAASNAAVGAKTKLGKDAFMKLLFTELRYQDPLSPMNNREFITQLAEFSSLERLGQLSGSVDAVRGLMLLGKEVTVSADGELYQGTVRRVTSGEAGSVLTIGEAELPLGEIEWLSTTG